MLNVMINGHRYVPIKSVINTIQMALKDEKQDCFDDDEKAGFELAEKRVMKTLYKIGRAEY